MSAPENNSPSRTSSLLRRMLLGEQLPLMVRLGLFIVLTVLLVVATIILLPKLVILGPWGYVAGFIMNLLSSAAIVVPGPGFAAIMIMAAKLNPFILGIVVGIGGTIGELTGYWLGAQSREPLEGKRLYGFLLNAMAKMGGVMLLLFGLLPFLPVDAGGVLAGASRYPVSKFLIYVGIGKVLKSVAILYLAAKAFEWAEPYLRWLS
jgi:membrane protein YqaA with SNARE-associated domain